MKVWLDGDLVDEAEAKVSAFDHGLLTGDGVFETLKVYRGQAFAMRRHLHRLAVSAAGMGLTLPSPSKLRDAIAAVVDAGGLVDGRIRITVTGGPAPLGSDRGRAGPTVIVAAGLLPAWPETTDVIVVPWPRNERSALTGLKTTSYGENVVALSRAAAAGAGEAVFGNLAGNLCEGTGSNVFCAIGGRLLTPPLASGCLAGVTRGLLLELLPEAVEADLEIGSLAEADEAFLTSTTREVQPVRAVDGRALAACPGPYTLKAAAAFSALAASEIDP